MPYVGNPLADAFSSREKQDLTGQSGTSFTLTHAVSHANDLSVYINHVRQEPTTAYSVNGTTLTTTGSVAGTDDFYIIYDELALQSISHPTDQALTATSGTFTSGLVGTTGTFSGALSATTGTFSGAVDIQGQELILDADNDTSITADTDDQIDIKVGGNDTAIITADTVKIRSDNASLVFRRTTSETDIAKIQYVNGNPSLDIGADGKNIRFINQGSYAESMRIKSDGNVGIGTTNPGTKLQIVNDTDTDYNISTATTNAVLNLKNNTSGASNCVGMSFSTESNGEWYLTAVQEDATLCGFRFGARTGGSRYDRMEINSDGTVKIGTSTQPTAWGLRVYNNSGHATIQAKNTNGGNMLWQGLNLNGSQSSTISESGVGYFANGVSSDETLKNVKGAMNDGWSKLKDVQPKSFTWKKVDEDGNKSDEDLDGNIHYGVMAQDLKKVIPDLAYGEEGNMSVDYNGLLMVAINTIKELEARITALESK